MAHDVHLVGSVPLSSAAEVFETTSAALGKRLSRIPDGETGARGDWITWLEPVFAENPAFERSDETFRVHAAATPRRRYRLRPGHAAASVRFDNLFYADIARASYDDFKRLRDAGRIAAGTRFQIDLVPPHSVIWLFVAEDAQAAIDPLYNEALAREIDKIAATLPQPDLAIQFDVASAVFARLQRGEANPYGSTRAEMLDRFVAILARLGERVPREIELLFHFCYGDSNHRHVVEPKDMGDMVEFANRLTQAIARPIELIHMPGAARSCGRCLFRSAPRSGAASRDGAVARPRSLHRRRRRHRAPPRHRTQIRCRILGRHRMRLRPPREGDHPGTSRHSRTDRRARLKTSAATTRSLSPSLSLRAQRSNLPPAWRYC
jgi:hypothetical protein